MPYRCVHCSSIFENGSKEIVSGCSNCKSKFFFYIKDEKMKEIELMKESEPELSSKEKEQIEKDVRDLTGVKNEEQPVFLDFESIKVLKPGKYLFDLQKLFATDKPRVYKLEDGKYIIDLNVRNTPKKRI